MILLCRSRITRYKLPSLCRPRRGGLFPLRKPSFFSMKGCENFVCLDGIWKLRHPHCLYPVKADVSGLPTLNYPNVCAEEPETQSSAFCEEHSQLAKEKNIPTNLRAFIHDYCQVSKNSDGESLYFITHVSFGSCWLCCASLVGITRNHVWHRLN